MSLMFKKNNFIFIVLLILLALFIGVSSYYSNKVHNLENEIRQNKLKPEVTKTKPKLDSKTSAKVSEEDGVLVPKVIYRDTGSVKTVIEYDTIRDVDTVEVLIDYFSLKTYIDSITSQDVEIKVIDTIQKNSIFAREYQVKNLRTEDFYKRRMVYLGGDIGFNKEQLFFGPSITYIDKSNNLFKGSYLLSNNHPTIMISYGKKIQFKK